MERPQLLGPGGSITTPDLANCGTAQINHALANNASTAVRFSVFNDTYTHVTMVNGQTQSTSPPPTRTAPPLAIR
jgi:hypothetical protein